LAASRFADAYQYYADGRKSTKETGRPTIPAWVQIMNIFARTGINTNETRLPVAKKPES
jgi:hypothetical protein